MTRSGPTLPSGWLRRQDGVTLIEILAAMLIFAVVAAGMTLTTMATMRATAYSRNAAAAAALVNDMTEDLRALSTSGDREELAEGAHEDPLNPIRPLGEAGPEFLRRWTVERDTPSPGLATVEIEVEWGGAQPGKVRGVTLVCESDTCT